jgi:4-amino-4-deoxy-L-arabinose transferase-like glycosyltransferase
MRLYSRWLILILLLALGARAAILIYAEHYPGRFDYPDSHRYIRVARNIAAGRGPIESDAVLAGTDPLYPAILATGVALGFDTSGNDDGLLRFGRIVNAILGLAAVALLATFGRQLLTEVVGLIAAAILALDPILLFFNALVLTEICYLFLLLASLCCLVHAGSQQGRRWGLAAGLLIGLSTATRSTGLFLPLLLAPFAWYFAGGKPAPSAATPGPARLARRAIVTVCFLVAALCPLAPTVIRNYSFFGRFVPVRTGGGASLMEALGPWADGGPGMDRIIYPPFPAGANECERDRLCQAEALAWARQHPGETLHLVWAKLRRTWSVTLNAPGYSSPCYAAVAWATVGPEFIMAVVGIWTLRRQRAALALMLVVPFYFTLLHMIFVGSVRYRVPAMPMVYLLAGAGLTALWRGLACRTLAVCATEGPRGSGDAVRG